MTSPTLPAMTDTAIPAVQVGRNAVPNPFDGVFPLPEGKAKAFVMPSGTEDEKRELTRMITFAQKAARAAGVTCRTKREDASTGSGKNRVEQTRVTFWNVPKITHKTRNGHPVEHYDPDNDVDVNKVGPAE